MAVSLEDVVLFINSVKDFSEYDFTDYSVKSFTRRLEKVLTDNNGKRDSHERNPPGCKGWYTKSQQHCSDDSAAIHDEWLDRPLA